MIDYKQLEATGDGPPDVECVTDDREAEMAALENVIEEMEFDTITLPDKRDEDGNFRFVIPASSVSDFAEGVWEIDNGKLDDLTEQWNAAALEASEDG